MSTPATAATKLLSNKWFWITLVVLIIALVVYKNGNRWWAQLTRRDQGNYAGQDAVEHNSARAAELQQMARDANTAINSALFFGGVTATGREEALGKLLTLNHTEVRYVANFYKGISPNGTTLKNDVDDEEMPFSSVDEQLVALLNQLNL